MFAVFLMHTLFGPLPSAHLFDLDLFSYEMAQGLSRNPLIVPSIEGFVMDVVLIAILILLLSHRIIYIC